MPRKKRRINAKKHTAPPSRPPSPEMVAFEAQLDEFGRAYLDQDTKLVTEILAGFETVPPFAPEAITRRLIEDREPVSGPMLLMLSEIAGDDMDVYLNRIATNRATPDMTRFESRRILGFDEAHEVPERTRFLKSLKDGLGILAQATKIIGLSWPAHTYLPEEVLAYLAALVPSRQRAAIVRIRDEAGPYAIPILHALLHFEEPATQRLAIDALASFHFAGSQAPLERIRAAATDPGIREHATTVLQEVTFDLTTIPPADDEMPPFPPDDIGRPDRTVVGPLLATGEQSLFVIRHRSDLIADVIEFVTDDVAGVLEAIRTPSVPLGDIETLIFATIGDDADYVDVPPAAARGLLAMAIDTSIENGFGFGLDLEFAEPFVHDTWPVEPHEPVIDPVLDDTGFETRNDLVEQSAVLLGSGLMPDWSFDPFGAMQLYIPEDVKNAGNWSEQDISQAVEAMATPEEVARIPQRLRRVAYMLDLTGDKHLRDTALAVSASLCDPESIDLTSNAFLQAMARETLLSLSSMRAELADFDMSQAFESMVESIMSDPKAVAELLGPLGRSPKRK